MTCTVTGVLRNLKGEVLPFASLTLVRRGNVVAQEGVAVIPNLVEGIVADENGLVTFEAYPGVYEGRIFSTLGASGPFRVGVPDQSSVSFWETIDALPAITPSVESAVYAAVARAEAWAESATAPDPLVPTSKSAKTWAGDAEAAADRAEAIGVFDTRAQFTSWTATNTVVNGRTYWVAGLPYTGQIGATVTGLLGLVPSGDATPFHYGAVGDNINDDRAAFAAMGAAGGAAFIPKPPVAYKFSAPLNLNSVGVSVDPSATYEQITGSGALTFGRGDHTDVGNGATIWRLKDRVFIGAPASDTSGVLSPGVKKSWVGYSAGGFMTYFESRATLSVASRAGGVGVAGSSQSSENTKVGELNTIGGAFFANNNNANGADKKSAWAIYGHASMTKENRFTAAMELDVCSLIPAVALSPFTMGLEGGTATAWIGVGGETAQQKVEAAEGADLTNVSCAVGVVNTATGAAGNRFAKGILFGSTALAGTDGASGYGVAMELASFQGINWKYSSAENAFGGQLRAQGQTAATHQRLVMGNSAFTVRGVQSDLSTETTLFSVNAPVAGVAAVNFVSLFPGLAGSGLTSIFAGGPDTNIDLRIGGKGNGTVRIEVPATLASVPANFSANRYIRIKDSTGLEYYIPCMGATW